jgi:hypothetical protein
LLRHQARKERLPQHRREHRTRRRRVAASPRRARAPSRSRLDDDSALAGSPPERAWRDLDPWLENDRGDAA